MMRSMGTLVLVHRAILGFIVMQVGLHVAKLWQRKHFLEYMHISQRCTEGKMFHVQGVTGGLSEIKVLLF